MTDQTLQAYCVKCKTKRDIASPEAVYTSGGTPGTRGQCPVCGTTLFRMGSTAAHEGLPRPEVTRKPKRSPSSKSKTGSKKAAGQGKKRKSARATGDSGVQRGKLVIVESPAKARTVGRYLGKGYTVKASKGHVRDLLSSKLSVDVENNFEPTYRVPNEKREVVKELKAASAQAKEIYLATDPDREGEAIAWHLIAAAGMDTDRVQRVVFHEITENAIREAFAHARAVNMDLVNAQQARRILDRLVGYSVTELLWDKVRNGLSGGRVQSVALRLVVDREREIQAFVPEEYWTLHAELAKQTRNGAQPEVGFLAKLLKIGDQDAAFKVEGDVTPHLAVLKKSDYIVAEVKNGIRQRRPAAPFTTSTLQQEASRQLNFNAKRTMRAAQDLYEGIDIGAEGITGLITYMRTDSTNVAREAQDAARQFIAASYGKAFLPGEAPVYKTKAKSAQEAHEAIRPTSIERTPEQLRAVLSKDQHRLYTLVWQRFVASQMANAVYATRRVDVNAGLPEAQEKPYLFRATGSQLTFSGFLKVYEEMHDEGENGEENDEDNVIPEVQVGERLDLRKLLPKQHFTQPPPRFTEASLVKALEERGIGRPSTYEPTVAVIQKRDYVQKDSRHLVPTDTGTLVNDLLVQFFPDLMNYDFTARLEDKLDNIAAGENNWVPMLDQFYQPFAQKLKHARQHMPSQQQVEYIGRSCPECGDGQLLIRYGKYGKFIGCSNYPDCRYTEPWLDRIGVTCPQCGGDLVEKKSRRGKTFYGCANYPACDFTSWKRPQPQPCPNCGGLLVQKNKNEAQCIRCMHTFPLEALPATDPAIQAASAATAETISES